MGYFPQPSHLKACLDWFTSWWRDWHFNIDTPPKHGRGIGRCLCGGNSWSYHDKKLTCRRCGRPAGPG